LVTSAFASAAPIQAARASSWHLLASFGRGAIAGLPVRERLQEEGSQGTEPFPERYRSLLAPGPKGSVFVGGFAEGKPGAFLLTRMTATGTLDRRFAHGGVILLPAIHWFRTDPPRLITLPDGKLLIVGLDRTDRLVAVRITSQGALDRGFGHDGVAQYPLADAHKFTIITAAILEPGGDLLAVYQKELPQPVNQPRVPEGQGNGSIKYVRLLPSGALDSSFGKGGFVTGEHTEVTYLEGESGTIGACGETLSPDGSLLIAYSGDALEELSSSGKLVKSFGQDPVAPSANEGISPPSYATKNGFHFCDGLFALSGGGVEGVQGDRFARLTSSGMPETTFGTGGSTTLNAPVDAVALASDGEIFSAGESGKKLVIGGILPDGQPDPALGSGKGQRFTVALPNPHGRAPGEKLTWEVLSTPNTITVRVGEKLIRLTK
jgi:uncharacterized delta-60 repeat protein